MACDFAFLDVSLYWKCARFLAQLPWLTQLRSLISSQRYASTCQVVLPFALDL